MSRRILSPALFALALAAGCGPTRYPVAGKVTYEDGKPVPAGTVIGEAKVNGATVSVQGAIDRDGGFQLGGAKAGDGAIAGTYRFVVMPIPIPDGDIGVGKLPDVDEKFTKFDTSGITLEVKPPTNALNIKVSAPLPKPVDPVDPDKADPKAAPKTDKADPKADKADPKAGPKPEPSSKAAEPKPTSKAEPKPTKPSEK